MVIFLRVLFLCAMCSMAYAAVQTALLEGFGVASSLINYWWFNATLLDVYLGIMIFSLWAFYKESSLPLPWLRGFLWTAFFLMMGNIGTSFYLLVLLLKIPAETTGFPLAQQIFLTKSHIKNV